MRWCADCHLVSPGAATATPGTAPPFQAIGRSRTPDQVRTFLAAPHGGMPDLALQRSEIDDLAAYIARPR